MIDLEVNCFSFYLGEKIGVFSGDYSKINFKIDKVMLDWQPFFRTRFCSVGSSISVELGEKITIFVNTVFTFFRSFEFVIFKNL